MDRHQNNFTNKTNHRHRNKRTFTKNNNDDTQDILNTFHITKRANI